MVLWLEKSLPQLLYRLEQDVRVKVIRIHNCESPGECGLLSGIPRRRMALASASDVRRRLWSCLFDPWTVGEPWFRPLLQIIDIHTFRYLDHFYV